MTSKRVLLALCLLLVPALASPVTTAQQGARGTLELTDPVQATALAVALTESGQRVGASAQISVTVATGGSGHVFIDTRPLAGTDMQGSARIAARVASAVTGYALEEHDFFFVVRSQSPIISGPSAGGIMTAATVAAMENAHLEEGQERWELSGEVLSTGTIGPDGSIGPVGGILEKAQAAADRGAHTFLVPEGQGTYTPRQLQGGLVVSGQPVNVSEHCREEIGIQCQEVGTIEELVRLTTGHAFQTPDLGQAPSTADYNETMAPLSRQLIDESEAFRTVWDELNASSLGAQGQREVDAALQQARDFHGQAQAHWRANDYYSAASRAFTASIHATHAALLLSYYSGGRSLDQVADELSTARQEVGEAEAAAGEATVTDMHALYTVGAAQERVSDAEARLNAAEQAFNQTSIPEALFHAAWARERAETVHWWLSLSEPFGAGPSLPVDVEQLADEFIQLGDEMVAYSTSVLQGQEPQGAVQQLERAKADDQRGFHAAALVEAAQAQVRAALAVELASGAISQDKVNASQENAARAIQQARSRGVEPVLAVAMFEFAGAQEQGAIALEFYRTARVYAGFSSVLTGESEPHPSRFVGDHQPPEGFQRAVTAAEYRTVAVGWLTIGVFSTLALVVLIMALTGED